MVKRKASGTVTKSKKQKPYLTEEMKKAIRSMMFKQIEIKRLHHVDYVSVGSNTGWVLPWPSQGVGVGQRIGDRINLDSFLINATMSLNFTADSTFRLVVHMPRSASLLGSADLFTGGSGNYITATINTNYTNVLLDYIIDLPATGPSMKTIRAKVPLKNMLVTFDEGSAVPEARYIQVYIANAPNTGIPGTGGCRFSANFETRFRDA